MVFVNQFDHGTHFTSYAMHHNDSKFFHKLEVHAHTVTYSASRALQPLNPKMTEGVGEKLRCVIKYAFSNSLEVLLKR